MEKQILFRTVSRCVKNDIIEIFGRWNFMSEENLSRINTKNLKQKIAQDIYEMCQDEGVDMHAVGDLDLTFAQLHSNRWKWSVYELRNQEMNHFISNPTLFRKQLLSKLKLYFNQVHVNVNLFSSALWARIHIIDTKASTVYKQTDVVYLIHYPKTHYVIMSRIKAKDEDSLLEALQPVFKTDEIHDLHLVGHKVSSLVELALNKDSQGSFGKYRSLEAKANPLSRKTLKRKASTELEKEFDKRLKSENKDEKSNRTEMLTNTFGKHEQPELEKLEYKMDVKFRGLRYAPAMANYDKPFRCRIKFEGNSVLEGIRQLGQAGLADMPLPSHLAKVPSLAKNFFVIRDKNLNKSRG